MKKNKVIKLGLGVLLLLSLGLLAGCGTQEPTTNQAPTTPSPRGEAALGTDQTLVQATDSPTATPTIVISPTASPSSIPTITPSPSPLPSATPTPTATPTPLHPLSIERLRQEEYPGSEIVIEQNLEPGANYNRYVASYLSEGFKIYALLTVPFGERPESGWPVVVFNHGYIPPEQYRTTERYVAYVDGFARNGYIVFRSDYRGHGSSEGQAAGAYGSPAYTIDVLNAVAALQQYPDADPDRIGMWGHSMGGHITLRAMVISPDIKVGVIWAGVIVSYPDLISRWRRSDASLPTPTPDPENPRRRWRFDLAEQYGTPEENPAFWDSISANSFLTDLSGPVQLHHGTGDTSVPVEFSEIVYQELLDAGQAVELYLYEGDDHNLANYFTTAMNRSIQFFDQHLKN